MSRGKVSAAPRVGLRKFETVGSAYIQKRVWDGSYLRRRHEGAWSSGSLVRVGLGMDWYRDLAMVYGWYC